jgi:hypothetical protein
VANRTATYFAFDGLGKTDPTKSDFKYYATVQGWDSAKSTEFSFTNSHDKASAVRDSSKIETLKSSILKRLSASKNMVVILSPDTRNSGSLLSYEIEKAVDTYEIPLICAYTGYKNIFYPRKLSSRWPDALTSRIDSGKAEAIHVPFKMDPIMDAIGRFTVNGEELGGPLVCYSENAFRSWNLL